ncbi:MAG: serine/threonine-protein kinase [Planctomycetota bacterium]
MERAPMNFSPDESLTDEGNIPRDELETILAQIVEAAERGEPVDLDAWLPGDPAAQQRAWELIGKVRALAGLGRRCGKLSHPKELCGRRLDEYQIQDELGRGGFGVVYRGVHVKLGQRVAIKCLRPELLLDPHFRQRQQREMEILGGLEHKNILRPLDARVVEGIPLIVTEFVEGENLASLIERAGKLSLAETCEIARQVADGLDYAHQHDVVHRDVKPHNIIYNEKSGLVKILDFGLSRLTCGTGTLDASLTSESMYVGAPAYTAPEQWIRASDVTGNADVYALGCVIYYCLHGRAMYEGDSHMELAFEHCHGPTPELGNVPEDLRRLWRRMVSKTPDDRPSASSVSRFLVNLCAGNLASILPRLIEQLEEPHVCGLLRDEMSLVRTHFGRLTPLRAMSLFRDAGSLLTAKRGMSGEERALCALVFACLEIEKHDLAFQIGKRVIEQVPNCSEVRHYTAVAAIHYRAESPEEGEEYLRAQRSRPSRGKRAAYSRTRP